jgi:hypothetical protein
MASDPATPSVFLQIDLKLDRLMITAALAWGESEVSSASSPQESPYTLRFAHGLHVPNMLD